MGWQCVGGLNRLFCGLLRVFDAYVVFISIYSGVILRQEATGGPRRPKEATEVGGKGYRQILLSFILKFTGGKCYRQKSFKFFFGKSDRANGM